LWSEEWENGRRGEGEKRRAWNERLRDSGTQGQRDKETKRLQVISNQLT
jgi:hypothetical protein